MSVATLTSKGQMTLPKDVREDLHLKPGDKIEFVTIGESAIIVPRNREAGSLFGLLAGYAIPQTELADYDAAIRSAVADHVEGEDGERTNRKPGAAA